MHFSELMKKCKDEGINISRMGLYYAGKKHKFIIQNEESRNDFDKEKFLKWIELAKEKAPEGWVTVNELHKVLNISLSQAYILIQDKEANAKPFGTKGVIYVDPERIKEIINKRDNRYEL